MKKKSFVSMLLILSLVLIGCKLGGGDKNNSTDDWSLEKDKNNLFDQVKNISRDGRPADLVAYLDTNMIRMRSEELTESVYILNTMQKKYLRDYNKFIGSGDYGSLLLDYMADKDEISFNSREDLEEIFEDLEDEKLRDFLIEAYGGDYRLIKVDQDYKFIIDYDRYRKYETSMLSEVKDYIDIQREDQAFGLTGEVDLKKLGDKLIGLEDHLRSYAGGFGCEDLLRIYSKDLIFLMEGDQARPIVDEDNKIKSDVLEAYKSIVKKEGITSEAISTYLNKIEEFEGERTEEVVDSVLTIHNRAIAMLEK